MWAGTHTTQRPDGRVFRIRYNSEETGAVVAALLGDTLVDPVPTASELYSIELQPPAADRQAQPLHALYADGCTFVRSRDPMRVVRALIGHIGLCDEIPSSRFLRIQGVAVAGERGAALLPIDLRRLLAPLERRLVGAGLRLVDTPYALFDPMTGDLVVPEPPVVPDDVLDGIDLHRGPVDALAAPPGRHRLRGWLLDDLRGAPDRRKVGMRVVLNAEALGGGRARRVVGKIQDRAALVARWYPWPDDVVSAVARLAEGRR